MGGSSSKSPFDRRNSVERRTQRRVLSGIKDKIKKIENDVNKFNGVPGDEEYERLSYSIVAVQQELVKKHASLQPKNKVTSVELQKQAEKYLETLVEKAKINQRKQSESNNNKQQDDSSERRQTVELRVVKIEAEQPQTSRPSSLRSPEETRKSILKVGVPVMPNAAKELERKVKQTEELEEEDGDAEDDILKAIENVKKQVEDIELRISEFVGLKNGTRYTHLKGMLMENLLYLKEIPNQSELIVEQKEMCVQYIRSCLNFLDEKAEDGEVFSSDNEEGALPSIPPKGIRATLI